MKNKYLFLILFFVSFFSKGQDFISVEKDTLKFSSRSGSIKNDSLDLLFTSSLSLNPGGYLHHPFGKNQTNYSCFTHFLSTSFIEIFKPKIIYTTLPHLGFMYSFGSKGVQFMHTDFQHLINKNTLLNFTFEMNALGEMLRNGNYRNSNINLQLLHDKNRFKNHFIFDYQQSTVNINGGITDSLKLAVYPFYLLDVNKNDANSKQIQANLQNQFAFNFLKDSLNFIGLTLKNKWNIQQRTFEETGTMSSIYSNVYIDSFTTRDQFQVAKLTTGIGTFLQFKNFTNELLINHTYWDYQNLARHNDTSEVVFEANTELIFKAVTIKNKFNINLLGAHGEFSNLLSLKYELTKLRFNFHYLFENQLPKIQQRNYFSNNQSWYLSKLTLQQNQEIKFSSEFKSKLNPYFALVYKQLNNNYFFVNETWRNDTLKNLDIFTLQFKLSFNFKAIGIQPLANFNWTSKDFSYAPKYDFRMRLFFNKKLFKAKKLGFTLGFDVSFISQYQLLNYNSTLGIYDFQAINYTSKQNFGIDFFTGFELNVFRFYIKLENIDYIWNDRINWTIKNYPNVPMFFRFGLTWDFFN